MAYGGQKGMTGEMTINEFMSFLTAMLMSYQPARALSQLNVVVTEGITAADRVLGIIDIKPEITDPASAKTLKLGAGEIRLENICFDYIDGTSALKDVSFGVPAGKTVALVGPSGAGKTTIFNMIPRFYDAKVGRILVDDQDVRDVTLESLRRAIAIVTQEPFLFDDTVRANIGYGRPDASDSEIETAARDAAAHDFIMKLPHQYDTVVGESGVKLSGGQRQRLAIARAMLADAPILLMDEATSALDSESERQIQTALKRLMKGRTTLVIAHRLSTIIDADNIVVLDGGRVVEKGAHAELLAKQQLYAKLYQTQFDMPADRDADTPPPKKAAGE
jgi:subfamily B ATP-binding cassette protein MsbA